MSGSELGSLALEEILLARGLVTRRDLDGLTLDGTGRRSFADRVVAAGLVAEEQICFAISEELGYPLVTLTTSEVDADLVRRVPAELLRRHRALPLLDHGDVMDVAFADPTDSRAIAVLSKALARRVRPAVATSTTILAAIRHVLGAEAERVGAPDTDGDGFEASGAMRLYARLLACVEEGATELHVVPVVGGGSVRVRRADDLVEVERLSRGDTEALLARLRTLSGAPAAGPAGHRRAAIATAVLHRDLLLSISFVPTVDGEAVFVGLDPAGGFGRGSPAGIASEDATRLAAAFASADALVVVNDAREERARALVATLLAGLPSDGGHVVVVAEAAGLPERALRLAPSAFPGGLAEASTSGREARPDVLVVIPGPAALPPRETVLLAGDGRRVVVVGAWRDAAETVLALRRLDLPAGSSDASLSLVATVRDGKTSDGRHVRPSLEVVRFSPRVRDRLASAISPTDVRRALSEGA